jgi:hypothetical protein
MNDKELDAILNTWEAPDPSPALREAVRHGLPHAPERHGSRWLAAAAAIFVTAVLSMGFIPTGRAQLNDQPGGGSFFDGFAQNISERHLQFAMWLHSLLGVQSQHGPRLYIDNVKSKAAVQKFGEGTGVHFFLPAQNIYVLTLPGPNGQSLQPAGTVNGSLVVFNWQGKSYHIDAREQIAEDGEQPVYVLSYADFHKLHR